MTDNRIAELALAIQNTLLDLDHQFSQLKMEVSGLLGEEKKRLEELMKRQRSDNNDL